MAKWQCIAPGFLFSSHWLGICILLAMQALYFLKCRGSTGRGVLICAMVLACAFGMVQMIHQVVFTAMFVQLLRSAGTVEAIGTL
jgi:hypothetical protein